MPNLLCLFLTLYMRQTHICPCKGSLSRLEGSHFFVPLQMREGFLLLVLLLLSSTSQAFLQPAIQHEQNSKSHQSLFQQGRFHSPAALHASPPKRLTVTEQLQLSPNRWKRNGQPLEPGVGGIWPGKPDAKKYKVRMTGDV